MQEIYDVVVANLQSLDRCAPALVAAHGALTRPSSVRKAALCFANHAADLFHILPLPCSINTTAALQRLAKVRSGGWHRQAGAAL